MSTEDRHYFLRRTEEEFALGDGAPSPRIAAVHYEMAYRYASLCGKHTADILPFPMPQQRRSLRGPQARAL